MKEERLWGLGTITMDEKNFVHLSRLHSCLSRLENPAAFVPVATKLSAKTISMLQVFYFFIFIFSFHHKLRDFAVAHEFLLID